MSEQENTALVQKAYQLFTQGNIPELMKLISDDVDWNITEVENVPFTGRFRGHDGVGRFFGTFAATVDVLKFDVQELVAQRDKVVVLGESVFKIKDRGTELANKFAHVITVANGKLKHFQDYGDTAKAAKAFAKK